MVGYDLIDKNIAYLEKDTIDYLISQNSVEQGYRSLMRLFQSVVMKEKIIFQSISLSMKI